MTYCPSLPKVVYYSDVSANDVIGPSPSEECPPWRTYQHLRLIRCTQEKAISVDVSGVCKDGQGSLLYTALDRLNAEPQIAVIPSGSSRGSPITRFSLRAVLWPERAAGGTRLKAEL